MKPVNRIAWFGVVGLALAVSGCNSFGPGGVVVDDLEDGPIGQGPCASSEDCPFGMQCIDGLCIEGPANFVEDSGCVDDDDCPDGWECAESTGICIDAAREIVFRSADLGLCVDGEQRKCGSKVGECRYGWETCVDSEWSGECVGGVGPIAELCNGLDDDCDGIVPSDEVDMDNDGVMLCDGDCDDSDPTVAPIMTEICDGIDNDCDTLIDENTDSLCDDGLFCNGAETCTAGACASGAPPVCTDLDGACVIGACDETSDSCSAAARPDGTACTDTDLCTTGDTCQSGICTGGSPVDCSAASNACNTGACSPTTGRCEPVPVVDGTPCDDSVFCTAADACLAGVCSGGGTTDCSAVTGGDTCYDGICNLPMDQCVAVDNGTCDTCEDGTPTANAGVDQETVPNDTITLDGSGSTDPDSSVLNYAWSVTSRPDGSVSTLSNPTAVGPTFLADLAGDYIICLTVTDGDGCVSEPDCMNLTVVPQVSFHVELTWDTLGDMDLHYRTPLGAFFDSSVGTDAYYMNPNPDWGPGGVANGLAEDNPVLDVDNISGFGPENINQGILFDDPGYFRVGVHYYCNSTAATTVARIRIYVDGQLAHEDQRVMASAEFWEVAEVQINQNATQVDIQPLVNQTYFVYAPSCHTEPQAS